MVTDEFKKFTLASLIGTGLLAILLMVFLAVFEFVMYLAGIFMKRNMRA